MAQIKSFSQGASGEGRGDDALINEFVCELYGLTDEKIEIVKEAVGE